MPTVTGKVYNHFKRMKEKRAVLNGIAAELRRIIAEPGLRHQHANQAGNIGVTARCQHSAGVNTGSSGIVEQRRAPPCAT